MARAAGTQRRAERAQAPHRGGHGRAVAGVVVRAADIQDDAMIALATIRLVPHRFAHPKRRHLPAT